MQQTRLTKQLAEGFAAVVVSSRLEFELSELLQRLALQSSRVGVIGGRAILKDAALNAAVVICSRLAFESCELLHRLALQSSRVEVIGARAILKDAALNGTAANGGEC